MDIVQRWLHAQIDRGRDELEQWPADAREEFRQRAMDGLEALLAAQAITPEEAGAWRERFAHDDTCDVPDAPDRQVRDRAEQLLGELLGTLTQDGEDCDRFEGACHLLAAVGAIDASAWDARRRAHLGWPTAQEERAQMLLLNAGGTQVELLAVRPGSQHRAGGWRVLLVLCFADGVTVMLDADEDAPAPDFPDWRLADDLCPTAQSDISHVLSETLRDVDLFVGVATIGNDPGWTDHGHDRRYRDYWSSYSVGKLGVAALTRRDVLSRLLPKLTIADQTRLEHRWLVVEGRLRTYWPDPILRSTCCES